LKEIPENISTSLQINLASMKKGLGALLVTFFISSVLFAQRELKIKSGDKGYYLEHKVAKGENFYSIGRFYYVNPKDLAAYNSMNMYKGLTAGKLINIPLTDSNFSQTTNKGKAVYYLVQDEQTLSEVGKTNKVATNNLRTWNHLKEDNVDKGQKLIVGYIVPPSANKATVKNETKTQEQKTKNKNVAATKVDNKIESTNNSVHDTTNISTVEPIVQAIKPKENADIIKQVVEKPVSKQGYFKWAYEQQLKGKSVKKNQTVTSGTFKSGSGWNDAKYYLLIDEIDPGTIVKLTNPSNNKIIYAKVLGDMKGVPQVPGMDVRISNAAASILEIEDMEKFILKLNY
jgi:LysM repeat protein